MRTAKLTWIGLVISIFPIGYLLAFGLIFNQDFSDDPASWGSFGDYFGGIVNPILSFTSVFLIIRSLDLQRAANVSLNNDSTRAQKNEDKRAFEGKFFRLIDALNTQYEKLEIDFTHGESEYTFRAGKAVIEIERCVENLIESGVEENIKMYLNQCDSNDSIYSCVRRFSLVVKLVDKELGEVSSCAMAERKNHYEILINFTDFGLLRLITLSVQHMDSSAAKYLKENEGFKATCRELGLEI
ncbi:hypothetical protein [Xanthomonas arboricola]